MSKFGIKKETKSTNRVDMGAGIHKNVFLKSVSIDIVGKEGKEQEVLAFHFVSTLGDKEVVKEHTYNMFQLDESKDKFEKSLDAFNANVKHIWEAFTSFPKEGIANIPDESTFLDYMKAICTEFNKNVGTEELPKTLFTGKAVNIKLVYGNKDFLSFPYAPNFIEPATNKVSLLSINPKYDKLTVQAKGSTLPGDSLPDDYPFA